MALKPWHKTRWNGHKRHKDELYIYRDMPFSSKRETTMFEIQTRDISSPLLRGRLQHSSTANTIFYVVISCNLLKKVEIVYKACVWYCGRMLWKY